VTTRLDASRLRPAGRATRDAIEDAAKELFDEHGYDGASVRAIASKAGIDPALVIRHFGSKEELFLHVYDRREYFTDILEGPIEDLGRSVIELYLGEDSAELRKTFLAFAGASHHENIRAVQTKRTREVFIEPLAKKLEGDHREARLMMAGAAVHGLLTALFLYDNEEIGGADKEYVIATYGDALQRILTP
jgi:AcrR family transcriptional regulator